MRIATLGEVFERITNGKNVRQNETDGGMPITRIETISLGAVDPSRVGYAGLERSANEKWLLRDGDILMSHINSPKHVGKCALYTNDLPEMVHGMNLLRLEPNKSLVDSSYAIRYFRTPSFRAQLRKFINQAVNQASISVRNLKSIEIALPPLDEQRRISDILGKADALRARRREAIAHLDTLGQSIFHEMFGSPHEPLGHRSSVPLTDFVKLKSGRTPARDSTEFWDGDIPWFSPKDIKKAVLEDSIEHISQAALDGTTAELLPAGSVIFVVRGMILAHTFPVAITAVAGTINQDMKAAIPLPGREFAPEYLAANLNGQSRRVIENAETSAHGTKRLGPQSMRDMQVIDAPLELQQEFARRVAAVENLKTKHRTQLAELDELFLSLQDRAFKGEL